MSIELKIIIISGALWILTAAGLWSMSPYVDPDIDTLARSHAVMWVDLEIQKRHLLMLARSHEELINQANSNTMATQGESGMFNLSQPVCYGCHEEI